MRVGYARISTHEQSIERQTAALKGAGCDRVEVETGSGKTLDRPVLIATLESLNTGDTLVLHELDRLGRSMIQMLVETERLMERGIHIVTLDGRLNTEVTDPMIVKLVVGILGYAAEMERKAILKRTSEGITMAKANGMVIGRKRSWTDAMARTAMTLRQEGKGYGTIASALGIPKTTVRRMLDYAATKEGASQ